MADEDEKVVVNAEEAVVGEEADEVETPATEPEETFVEEVSEAEKQQEISKQEVSEEKRPTRAERRIRELTQRLREMAQTTGPVVKGGAQVPPSEALSEVLGVPQEGQLPWKTEPEVYPGAELTPEEFERAVASRAATIADLKVRQVLAEKEAIEAQKEAMRSFADDAERLVREESVLDKNSPDYDETIDKAFSELVVKVNSDETGKFTPRIAPAEIWKQFSKALKKERLKGEESVTTKMVENAAKSVVSPTAKQTVSVSSEEELAEKLAKGEISAEEAEKILPKVDRWY